MDRNKDLALAILILSLFFLPSTPALADSTKQQSETYEKQKVEKLESGRYQQQKSDADQRGKTPENEGNFNPNVPRGEGIESPPAKSQPDIVNPSAPSGTRY